MVSKSRAFALLCAAFLCALPLRADNATESVVLTLPQAREVALRFALKGQPEQAEIMARELLKANPKDDQAWFAISYAWLEQGELRRARQGARRAFRYAESHLKRQQAADLAARAAFQDDRFTLAQYWMRRSAQFAPHEATKARVAKEFGIVRQLNPWRVSLAFSAAPTSNLNGGASSHLNEIEGLPFVGILSGSAQALSGTEIRSTTQLSYRLQHSQRSETRVHGLIYTRDVRLSEEAKALAPTTSNSDLNLRILEGGLSKAWKIGARGATVQVRADTGQVFSGNDPYYAFNRLTLTGSVGLSETLTHRIKLAQEVRNPANGGGEDVLKSIEGQLSWKLRWGDTVNLGVKRKFIDEPLRSRDGQTDTLSFSYWRKKPVAGLGLGLELSMGQAEYPDYMVAFFGVPDGRSDTNYSGALHMDFHKLDYMGFVPRATVRAYKTESNVSRFTTDGVSLSLGFRSAF